jgi:hypothetical protein
MRNRLIIWLILNLSVWDLIFVYPSLIKYPIWAICVFSSDLLKTKRQIKDHYFKKLPTWGVVLGLAFPVIMIIAALINADNVTGEPYQWLHENHLLIRTFMGCAMALTLFIFYKQLSSINKSNSQIEDQL